MDVTSVSSRLAATRFATGDVAAVLAARPAMAQLAAQAGAEASTNQDHLSAAIESASASGSVDLYL